MPDHVHLLVQIPTTVTAARLAQQVKGVSSTLARTQLRPGGFFGWQDGFGVFSVTHTDKERVCAYIQNQKQHHANDAVWLEWEAPETDAEASASVVRSRDAGWRSY